MNLHEAVERDLDALLMGVTLEGTDPAYGMKEELPTDDLTSFAGAMAWDERHHCSHPGLNEQLMLQGSGECPRCHRRAKVFDDGARWVGPGE